MLSIKGAKAARYSSSRPTARCRLPGASWPPTSFVASTSTANQARPNVRTASVSSSIASARTIADWGLEDGYFATHRRRRTLLSRPGLALPASARCLQFASLVQCGPVPPVRCERAISATGVGIRSKPETWFTGEPVRVPARQCLLHSARRRQHGRHHGARPQRGHALQIRQRHRDRSCRHCVRSAKNSPAAAIPAAHFRSCGCTTRSPRS